jgi:hypothetical protein
VASDERLIAAGTWGRVEWAIARNGHLPGKVFYDGLPEKDQAKMLALFKRLADTGRINNREKFKQLGPKAGKQGSGLWEFKSHQVRMLGDFRLGRRFLVAHGTRKQKDDLDRADIDITLKVLAATS